MNTVATGILALSLLASTIANDGIARGDEVPVSDFRLRVIQRELKTLPKLIPSLQRLPTARNVYQWRGRLS